MNVFLLSLIILFIQPSNEIGEVRIYFQKANTSAEDAQHFNEIVTKSKTIESNLHIAYLGASETLLAKHERSPAKKLRLFRSGVAHIEEAIGNDSISIEIRLIRLIIQNNAPAILSYSGNIKTDKVYILNNYNSAPSDVKKHIQHISNNTDIFTQEELTKIK